MAMLDQELKTEQMDTGTLQEKRLAGSIK